LKKKELEQRVGHLEAKVVALTNLVAILSVGIETTGSDLRREWKRIYPEVGEEHLH
jgi:hypothetical protein